MLTWTDNDTRGAWYYRHMQLASNSAEFERNENDYIVWTSVWPTVLDFTVLERPDSSNRCATSGCNPDRKQG